jgi:putative oligomerization/nucleic acid binding protein
VHSKNDAIERDAMFGQNKRLEKRLSEHGASAPAEVLEAGQTSMSYSTGNPNLVQNTSIVWKLKLQVKPATGAEFTADIREKFPQLSTPSPGMTLAVLYDPNDHSKVTVNHDEQAVLDTAVDQALGNVSAPIAAIVRSTMPDAKTWKKNPRQASKDMREQMREQLAGQQLPPGVSMGLPGALGRAPASDPVDALAKLADLRDRGVLSETEFQAQKTRILNGAA